MRRGKKVNSTGRSEGREQFVGIPYSMARSAAFRSLSGPALKVFIEIRTRFYGGNNGDLSLSLEEAKRLLCIGKGTAQRSFHELAEKGFLRMTRLGQWIGRRATTWRLTDKSYCRDLPSNDWKTWQRERPLPDLRPSVQ